MKIVKQTINLISHPLANFINLSIRSGITVPDKLKVAGVIPLYQSGENNVFSYYRPVSVLPAFSKVLEEV